MRYLLVKINRLLFRGSLGVEIWSAWGLISFALSILLDRAAISFVGGIVYIQDQLILTGLFLFAGLGHFACLILNPTIKRIAVRKILAALAMGFWLQVVIELISRGSYGLASMISINVVLLAAAIVRKRYYESSD